MKCDTSDVLYVLLWKLVLLIPGREINFPGLVRDSIDRIWVRQFSPAVIVNVIALRPWQRTTQDITCHFWRLHMAWSLITDSDQNDKHRKLSTMSEPSNMQ